MIAKIIKGIEASQANIIPNKITPSRNLANVRRMAVKK